MKNVIVIALLFLSYILHAKDINEIPFQQLHTEVGLGMIRDIFRDSKDFLWIVITSYSIHYTKLYDLILYLNQFCVIIIRLRQFFIERTSNEYQRKPEHFPY